MSKVRRLSLLALPVALLCTGIAHATGTLTATPSSVTITYTLGASTPATATTSITAPANGTFVYLDTSTNTLPAWLTVYVSSSTTTPKATTGTAGTTTGLGFTFASNNLTLLPGTYTTSVQFSTTASGVTSATVAVTLIVKQASTITPKANGSSSTTVGLSWTQGTSTVVQIPITASSSGEAIAFGITFGTTGTLAGAMTVDSPAGIAYPWGSATSTVTIAPTVLLAAQPGASLTGTIIVTPTVNGTAGTATTFNVTITVAPSAATITAISPVEIPVQASGTATVFLSGSGFVSSTTIKASTDGTTFSTTGVTATVLNSNNIQVVLANSLIASAGTLTLSAANGLGTPSTKTLAVVTTPIIQAVTNSASFSESSTQQVAPYEMITIFGSNFEPVGGAVVPGAPSADVYKVYPTSLTNSAGKAVQVVFYTDNTYQTPLGSAPILFVSSTQINAIVPAGVNPTSSGGTAYLRVIIDPNGSAATNDYDFPVTVVNAVPGIFTSGGTGTGAAAALNADFSLNSPTNPALHGTVAYVYASGLGAPAAGATDDGTVSGPQAYAGTCASTSSFLSILNGTTPPPTAAFGTTAGTALTAPSSAFLIDGAVIQSAFLYKFMLPPCVAPGSSGVQVKLGTAAAANPAYAGFVADSVAGLYQVNVTLPSTFTPTVPTNGGAIAVQLVINGSTTTQSGVTIYVK